MLYLDSSVLIKRYVSEKGSAHVAACFAGSEVIYTSSLSYAEVLSALSRKVRERLLSPTEADAAQRTFLDDWNHQLHEVSLDRKILASLPSLFRVHPLRGSDGVHLASAMWLQELAVREGASFTFGVSDERLVTAAAACALRVFNPETLEHS